MGILLNDVAINVKGINCDEILSDWQWLLGNNVELILISKIGDLFLKQSNQKILWLNTGTGKLMEVAKDIHEFKERLEQPQYLNHLFIPELLKELVAAGITIGPDECYSYKRAPILGGEIEPSNFEATNLYVHFSMLGQIHFQIKDLPPGTPINIAFEEP